MAMWSSSYSPNLSCGPPVLQCIIGKWSILKERFYQLYLQYIYMSNFWPLLVSRAYQHISLVQNCIRARINRRPWPSVPLLLAVMPLKILGYLRPKKSALFPLGRDALAVLCVPFCVAVMPFFQRLVLPFFRFKYSNNFLPIGIQIFEWTENCDPLIHSAEKKCKTKINNRKVTKLPTAKLIEIAVANCKHGHNFIEILHVSCTKSSPIFSGCKNMYTSLISTQWYTYGIGNRWLLARFSYESQS